MSARKFIAGVVAMLVALLVSAMSPVAADGMRWPQGSSPSTTRDTTRPPVIQLAPGEVVRRMPQARAVCPSGKECVTCVANCFAGPPQVVYAAKPLPTEPLIADGDVPEEMLPAWGRPAWAAIDCGRQGGCRVSGIQPTRRGHGDTVITVIGNFYIDR